MTVVVTGATGFIGSSLVRHLASIGEQVLAVGGPRSRHGIDSGAVKWLSYEENYKAITQLVVAAQPASVIHCVNHYSLRHAVSDIDEAIDANIRFGSLLLGALAEMPVQFINLSTFFQRQGLTGTQPNSFYAASKQAFSDIVQWFGNNSNLQVCDLMLFDTYGPGDKRNKLIPRLLECAAVGSNMAIQTPSAELNLCFINDVILGITDVVLKRTTGVWSLRAEKYVKVTEVVGHVESISGQSVVGKWGDTEPRVSSRIDTPPTLAGWSPQVSLQSGIEQCWKSIKIDK